MLFQRVLPFQGVVANGVATTSFPWDLTINRIVMTLGGTAFTKAMITDIKLKLGTRPVYQITGSRLDAINKWRGLYDDALHLTIDFFERDATGGAGKEIGGYDLSMFRDTLTMEVTIAGATAPTLTAMAMCSAPQGNELIQKLLYSTASTSTTGKFPINFNPLGALVKRIYIFYTGTDWTTTANGNVYQIEVKKNGLPIYDTVTDLESRFIQQEFRKAPQSRLSVVDFVAVNNMNDTLFTGDARTLELNPWLTAADALSIYYELIDKPGNA